MFGKHNSENISIDLEFMIRVYKTSFVKKLDGMTGSSRRLSNEGVAIRPNMPRSSKGSGNGYSSNKTPIVPIRGPPVPLALLPPPHTWPMFAAIPTVNGNIMARNHNGSGK